MIMSPHDASMWYRDCMVRVRHEGEWTPAIVCGFRQDLSLIARVVTGYDEDGDLELTKDFVYKVQDYDLSMPNAGYFLEDGVLVYVELRPVKTIRRSMITDRICHSVINGDAGRLNHIFNRRLAAYIMMNGRRGDAVGTIKTDFLAVQNGNIFFRGNLVGALDGDDIVLDRGFEHLKEYVNHALNR